jgi:colanic acid biosynthesis glycosyl transferase WcaI
MRILILTQWYPPEPALLMQEMAQTLIKRGHQVTVMTGFPNYPSGKVYPGYRLRLRQRETISGVPVVRIPLCPDHSRSGLRRAINYISFAMATSLLGPLLADRPDVLFVYHPPLTVGLPAYVLSRLWRVPFVYQIQDMWPETLRATGMLNNKYSLKWVGDFAKWVYARAQEICVISPGFQANLIQKGVPAEKIHVISNWVDTTTHYPEKHNMALAKKLGLAGRFNIMFAGNMGEAQGLETVLNAAELLRDLNEVQFVFVGDGVALPHLRQVAESQHLINVIFLGRYPGHMMPSLYALADVLLVHLKDDPLFRITIPHKIFTYMASGKPILAAIHGDAVDVVTQMDAGIPCAPQNPQAIAAVVRQFFEMTDVQREDMGARGLVAVQTKYSREALVGEIETLLLSAANGRH